MTGKSKNTELANFIFILRQFAKQFITLTTATTQKVSVGNYSYVSSFDIIASPVGLQ